MPNEILWIDPRIHEPGCLADTSPVHDSQYGYLPPRVLTDYKRYLFPHKECHEAEFQLAIKSAVVDLISRTFRGDLTKEKPLRVFRVLITDTFFLLEVLDLFDCNWVIKFAVRHSFLRLYDIVG